MTARAYCDGFSRRNFLHAGALSFLGLGLSDYLRWTHSAAAAEPSNEKSAIFIFLSGGPTHLDTFDLKPEAPAEFRGEFRPVATNVPGMEICELLPQLARQADKFALLRSVAHNQSEHTLGQQFLTTGNPPTTALVYPVYGSVAGKELGSSLGVPPFVSLSFANSLDSQENRVVDSAGYLGAVSNPFKVKLGESDEPVQGKKKAQIPATASGQNKIDVRALSLPTGLSTERIDARHDLLRRLDSAFRHSDIKSQDLDGMDQFYQQAYDMLRSPKAREAFDLTHEKPKTLEAYGLTQFGRSCLLARRLVEAGVRFVSINFGSWDAHGNIFSGLRTKLPELDAGLAGLLADLARRGRLEQTAVLVTGEFGRTPKLNRNAGRDHWSRAMSVLMAGGGIRGGQVIGQTNDKAEEPVSDPIKPQDVAVSFYRALGIDSSQEYHTAAGRPIKIVHGGKVIPHLFS